MMFSKTAARSAALVGVTVLGLALAGCGNDSSDAADSKGGSTTLSFLVDNGDQTVATAKTVATAFHAANPKIKIDVQTRPGGSDGDNLVKTRLSTGDMSDLFEYNVGSLLAALKPGTNLTAVDDQPWAASLDKTFSESAKVDGKLYGAPWGTAFGGGILYNIPVYKKLGLQIPKTWAEFMQNNDAIKKAGGVAPVIQTYGETWTSQLLVLGDYHNVEAQVPDFASQYTSGKAKYASTPAALRGFQRIEQVVKGGYVNKDYRSAKLNDGIKMVATGAGAHYPQLGGVASGIETVAPGHSKDVGFFALPGDDAASNGMTVWPGAAVYVAKTVKGAKLDAAKKFLAFLTSQAGCDAQAKDSPPVGPFLATTCKLPADVSQVTKDTQAYFAAGKASPALEFKSPIKGPALEQICIQVGTGQVSAAKGAALYDKDVRKQALQLGLPGWS